jgi:hypothetical protein
MIKQIFDRAFMLRHLNAFGPHLDQEIQLQNSGDAAALDRARQAGVTPGDMQQSKSALVQAQRDPKASEIREGQRSSYLRTRRRARSRLRCSATCSNGVLTCLVPQVI